MGPSNRSPRVQGERRARLPRTIAIDGPAASGKTTVGRMLAREFGYLFLDTGLMYRAFTLAAIRAGIMASDAEACERLARTLELSVQTEGDTRIILAGEDVTDLLRDPEVERMVSAYSVIAGVRAVMVGHQRGIARGRRAVLAGRDIGTVVLPRADLKLYLDASETARAERRSHQTVQWPVRRDEAEALEDIAQRDQTDSTRAVSPLKAAGDAIYIDTTTLTLDEVVQRVEREVRCWRG